MIILNYSVTLQCQWVSKCNCCHGTSGYKW